MVIKCLIVDDEPLAIQLIRKYLKHFQQFKIVAECENAIDALHAIRANDIDLIFLDMQMPELNGIDFLKALTKAPKVIITSAYKEFAIDGFNLDVLDFLLKPISLERFCKAINKYLELPEGVNQNPIKPEVNRITPVDDLFIRDNNKTYRVNPSNILYVEGMREYIKVVTHTVQIVTKSSLIRFYEQLPKDSFIRTHKSFIVNKQKVKAFTASNVEIGNTKIPIGRNYKISTVNFLNDR